METNMVGCSYLDRVMMCHGSVDLIRENKLPSERAAANEGVEAHLVAKNKFNGIPIGEISEEMEEAVDLYIDAVLSVTGGALPRVEAKLFAPTVSKKLVGIPDTWWFDHHKNVIHVWDFKYGHGYVDEYENWQLAGLAACVYENCNAQKDVTFKLHIVQPRCFIGSPVRTWETDYAELKSKWENIKSTIFMLDNAIIHNCVPSSACHKCPAAHVCTALAVAGSHALEVAFENIPLKLSGDALGCELRILIDAQANLKNRIDGLSQDAEYRIKTGEPVLGFHIEPSFGRLKWKYPIEKIKTMTRLLGVSLVVEKLITPPQAKKLGVDPKLIDNWTETPVMSPKLKSDGTKLTRHFKR